METRTIAPSPNVALVSTTARATPTSPRAAKFGEVLANSAVRSAESAVTSLPGGPMMALALRGGSTSVPLGTTSAALTTPTAAEGPGVTGAPSAAGSALPNGTNVESALQQSQEMNMQMLRIQQEVQQQNQQFTTMSNVMKAEHDTVKTAIGNIR